MDIIKITGLVLAAVVSAVVLKQHKKEMALAVTLTAGGIIIFWIVNSISPVINTLKVFLNVVDGGKGFAEILIKSLGICFLTEISADVCRDSGENALAFKTETSGKIALLLIAMPLFTEILNLVGKLIWM